MKKQFSLLALFALFAVASCGETSLAPSASSSSSGLPSSSQPSSSAPASSEGDVPPEDSSTPAPDDTEPEPEPETEYTLEDSFRKDYGNLTVDVTQVYDDGNTSEGSTEYIYDGYTIVYDEASATNDPLYYHDYEGESYLWFDPDPDNPNPVGAWLNKGYDDAPLGLSNTYFDLSLVFDLVDPADAHGTGGYYIIDDPALAAQLNLTLFQFAWFNDIQYIVLTVDQQTGYLSQILGLEEIDDDKNYVQIKLGMYGETYYTDSMLPPAPDETNVMEYWQYKGWDGPLVHKYLDALTLTPDPGTDKEGDSYLVDIEETIRVRYEGTPADADKDQITWHVEDDSIARVNYSFDEGYIEIEGLKEGTTTVWGVAESAEGEDKGVKSNVLTIQVRPLASQSTEGQVYDLTFTGLDEETGVVAVDNALGNDLPVSVLSNKAEIRQGNSDLFGENKAVVLNPGMQNGRETGPAYLAFDFDDQQVSTISFYYGMYYTSGMDALDKLTKVAIETKAADGSWTEAKDITSEVKDKISVDNKKLMEVDVQPTSEIRIALYSNMVGINVNFALDQVSFLADESCLDHVDAPETVPVESVQLLAEKDTVRVGDTLALSAIVSPSDATDKTVVYDSSDEEVATVDENGIVTALQPGQTELTATAGGIVSDPVTLTVEPKPVLDDEYLGTYKGEADQAYVDVTMVVEKDKATFTVEDTNPDKEKETATFVLPFVDLDEENDPVFRDTEGNEAVLDMSFQGDRVTVTATLGEYTINDFGTNDGFTRYVEAETITLTLDKDRYLAGDSGYVTAAFQPSDATEKELAYSSSDPDVVSIDPDSGTFECKKVGEATLTATNADGVTGTVEVVVSEPIAVTGLDVKAAKTDIVVDEKVQLEVSVLPEEADIQDVTFTSSDEEVLTVSSTGLVTGKGVGTAEVTVASVSNPEVTKTISFTVSESESLLPAELVGTWEGTDGIMYYTYTLEIAADGTATLLCQGLGTEIAFTFDHSNGSGDYYFVDENGYVLDCWLSGDYLQVTYEDEDTYGFYISSSYGNYIDMSKAG